MSLLVLPLSPPLDHEAGRVFVPLFVLLLSLLPAQEAGWVLLPFLVFPAVPATLALRALLLLLGLPVVPVFFLLP